MRRRLSCSACWLLQQPRWLRGKVAAASAMHPCCSRTGGRPSALLLADVLQCTLCESRLERFHLRGDLLTSACCARVEEAFGGSVSPRCCLTTGRRGGRQRAANISSRLIGSAGNGCSHLPQPSFLLHSRRSSLC